MSTLPKLARIRWIITMAVLCHQLVAPRLVTSQLLPASPAEPAIEPTPGKHASSIPVTIRAEQQEKDGPIYKLRGNVEIDYGAYTISGDQGTYNSDTGDVEAEGHLVLDG